ncbi:PDR/VanB family oxidoreductase [Pseudonocardia sp. KRD291]|uniref:PDR/VanB family oxidoreductase n=1 Tax=Pseudonocardia sp. KRD291 TaxID=2792007 RepID=UPI001C4A6FBF|nr:PDR/VanB family oxidoreductase [Pseudonocardia sp. KRD291]MBW0103934.1 oxidoreductase [Pseudonocardia sp. KRD291]
MQMIIHQRRDAADGVVGLTLGRTDGGPLPSWTPGAHVDVVLDNGLTRQYSLCSDPCDDRAWRIGVLREPESRGGSKYIVDKLHDGDIVEVGEPRNHFELEGAPGYVFVAGGIGITPLLPMIARAERDGAEWSLLYGGRTRSSMAFVDELARYGDRVTIAPQDEVGLLDLAGRLGTPRPDTLVYACGPEPLLDAVADRTSGWPAGSLRVERFTPRTLEPAGPDGSFEVEFRTSGITATVPAGVSILTVAEQAGIAADWSCREGTCGSCETPLLAGRAEHRDSLLTDEEKDEQNLMMICVSRAERGCPRLQLGL